MFRALLTVVSVVGVLLVLGPATWLAGLLDIAPGFTEWTTRRFSGSFLWSSGVRLTIRPGRAVLDPSAERYFIVGNHQSIIDIPVLLWACRGRLRFLAKDSLFRVPLFGPLIYRLGHVPVARSRPREAHEVLRAVVQCVSRHRHSLAAFPEGTRSEDGRLLQFRQGTMKIGQRSGLPILPFAIRGSGAVVRPRVFRAHPGPVELHFGLPIPAEEAARLSPAELTERIQEQVQRLLRLEPGEREAVPPGAGVGADAAPRTNDA